MASYLSLFHLGSGSVELLNDINNVFNVVSKCRDACAIGDASSDSFILTGGFGGLGFKVTRYNLKVSLL